MVTNGIGRPDPTGPSSSRPSQVDQTRQERERLQVQPGLDHAPRTPDQAQISTDAAEVVRYQELASLHREAYGPSERTEKLAEVRARLSSGHYDKPEVVDEIAGRLTDQAAASRAGTGELGTVRQRAANGFYDRPDVIDRTALNMVRSVLPGAR